MLGEMFLIADSDIICVIQAIPRGNSQPANVQKLQWPAFFRCYFIFSYFHSASPVFCTRHNILVLECGIVESCVTALSCQESMNLIYYYFSSSPTLYLEFRLITASGL